LARRLKQYGIKPKTLRLEQNVIAKGYAREDLHDVWRRYLTPLSDEPVTAVTDETSRSFQDVGAAGGTLHTSNEPLPPLLNAVDSLPVTGSATGCSAWAVLGNPQKTEDEIDVTPVTPSAGNGREPSAGLKRQCPLRHGALNEDETKADGDRATSPDGKNRVVSPFIGFLDGQGGTQPKQVRTIL
jgi:Protein of unknown function (DUF3631)